MSTRLHPGLYGERQGQDDGGPGPGLPGGRPRLLGLRRPVPQGTADGEVDAARTARSPHPHRAVRPRGLLIPGGRAPATRTSPWPAKGLERAAARPCSPAHTASSSSTRSTRRWSSACSCRRRDPRLPRRKARRRRSRPDRPRRARARSSTGPTWSRRCAPETLLTTAASAPGEGIENDAAADPRPEPFRRHGTRADSRRWSKRPWTRLPAQLPEAPRQHRRHRRGPPARAETNLLGSTTASPRPAGSYYGNVPPDVIVIYQRPIEAHLRAPTRRSRNRSATSSSTRSAIISGSTRTGSATSRRAVREMRKGETS